MDVKDWLGADNIIGIKIWNDKYKYNNETFEDWINRISAGNERIKKLILEKKFLFAGRVLAGRGIAEKVSYSNCYFIPMDDSIESIYEAQKNMALTYSRGGGCGICLSKLRPKDAAVNNAAKTTTGPVSFMESFNVVTDTIGQNNRRGALLISMEVKHPDIEDFIDAKANSDKITKANISVKINDEFMNAVLNKKPYLCKFELDNGKLITKEIDAYKLFMKFCQNNYDFGEPGVLYWDTVNRYSLMSEFIKDGLYHYGGVNPCGEAILPDYSSCNLGSLNLAQFIENPYTDKSFMNFNDFKEAIYDAVFAMNDVLMEGKNRHALKEQTQCVEDWRQIGLGIFGMADALVMLGIKYGSNKHIEFIEKISDMLLQNALIASNRYLIEKGLTPFKDYDAKKVLNSNMLKNINLQQETINAINNGLFNSAVLSIAPTGSLSTMLNVSGGVEPFFALSYSRKSESLEGGTQYFQVDTKAVQDYKKINNTDDIPDYFITSHDIKPIDRIKVQATLQKYIDASISSTVNLRNEATLQDVADIYIEAWKQGCKGITVFRDGCKRAAVLSTSNTNKEESKQLDNLLPQMNNNLKFGDTIMPSDNLIGLKKTIKSGCGTMHVNAYFDEDSGELREVFLSKGSKGGCLAFTNAVSRLISLLARKGAPLEEIVDQLNSVVVCPSYAAARAAGKEVSPGSSCAASIAKALLEMHNKFNNMFIYNDEEEEHEVKPVVLDKERITKEVNGPEYAICPECGEKTLMFTGGCVSCSCGYTKCELMSILNRSTNFANRS